MAFDTIVAYTYNADTHCTSCMRTTAAYALAAPGEAAFMGRPTDGDDTEAFLDRWAAREGIDRQDEHTFDSDDFPKVVFESSLEDCERCGTCGEHILGDDCITYPHKYRYGSEGQFHSAICQNGRCRNVGQGDPCGDGDCHWHPDNPDNPYTCADWVDNDWCSHPEHQAAVCPEFAEDGSCIHSDHMSAAGL